MVELSVSDRALLRSARWCVSPESGVRAVRVCAYGGAVRRLVELRFVVPAQPGTWQSLTAAGITAARGLGASL